MPAGSRVGKKKWERMNWVRAEAQLEGLREITSPGTTSQEGNKTPNISWMLLLGSKNISAQAFQGRLKLFVSGSDTKSRSL